MPQPESDKHPQALSVTFTRLTISCLQCPRCQQNSLTWYRWVQTFVCRHGCHLPEGYGGKSRLEQEMLALLLGKDYGLSYRHFFPDDRPAKDEPDEIFPLLKEDLSCK